MDEEYSSGRRQKRPYIKKQTNNAPGVQPPTSPPQIPDLAFNIHGWALEDGMITRGLHEVINAYKPTMSKGGFEAKIRSLESEGVRGIYRNDLRYTPREINPDLAKNDSSITQYLVVGYTLQEDDPYFIDNKTLQRYSEGELVGEERPSDDHLIEWDNIRTPILVVSPIKENTGTSVRLFGLIQPVSGLCHPVLLTHERIFYRWEYRASAGAKHTQRNKNWNQVIIDKAKSLTPLSQRVDWSVVPQDPLPRRGIKREASDPIIKQEEDDTGAYDGVVIELPNDTIFELKLELPQLFESVISRRESATVVDDLPLITTQIKVVLNEESHGILLAIRRSKSSRISKEIEASLAKIISLTDVPGLHHTALALFQQQGAAFDRDTAQMMITEALELWPRIGAGMHVDEILKIKHVMNICGVSLTPEKSKSFVINVIRFLRQNALHTEDDLQRTVVHWSQHAKSVSQLTSGDVQAVQLDTCYLVTLLKAILGIHVWQEAMMVPVLSSNAPPTFNTCYLEHYLNIEAMSMQSLSENLRQIVTYAKSKDCKIEDIQLWLERLRLRIRQVSE